MEAAGAGAAKMLVGREAVGNKKSKLGFSEGVRREMWSHDEQKEINDGYAVMARIACKHCGAIVHKYVESHYTGGAKCVILAKYCRFCGNALRI